MRNSLLPLLVLLAATPARAQAPAETGVTIYNDGRVLVRRTLPVAVPRGASTQRVRLGELDPATLFALDSGVTITGFRYEGAAGQESALRRAIGQRLVFLVPGRDGSRDTVSAEVVSADPLQLRMPDGRITFTMPGQALYPADVVVTEGTAELGLRSAGARDRLRLGWFTSGASWQASYQAILGGRNARVVGQAVLDAGALRAENAEVQLLAGAVSRVAAPVMARGQGKAVPMMAEAAFDAASQERVGEFHLYTLPERQTLLPGTVTAASLFAPASVPYERNYVVRGELPFYGMIPQHPMDTVQVPVEVSYTLKRPRESEFGGRPLPGGVARLFQPDSAGRLQLVGEAYVSHTPAGEDVRLTAGEAFDLTARRVQTAYDLERRPLGNTSRTIATIGYAVVLRNATDSAAVVQVREERGGDWEVLDSSVRPQRASAGVAVFPVRVPARGEAVLTYRIRTEW